MQLNRVSKHAESQKELVKPKETNKLKSLKDLPEVQRCLVKTSGRKNPREKSTRGKRVHDPEIRNS